MNIILLIKKHKFIWILLAVAVYFLLKYLYAVTYHIDKNGIIISENANKILISDANYIEDQISFNTEIVCERYNCYITDFYYHDGQLSLLGFSKDGDNPKSLCIFITPDAITIKEITDIKKEKVLISHVVSNPKITYVTLDNDIYALRSTDEEFIHLASDYKVTGNSGLTLKDDKIIYLHDNMRVADIDDSAVYFQLPLRASFNGWAKEGNSFIVSAINTDQYEGNIVDLKGDNLKTISNGPLKGFGSVEDVVLLQVERQYNKIDYLGTDKIKKSNNWISVGEYQPFFFNINTDEVELLPDSFFDRETLVHKIKYLPAHYDRAILLLIKQKTDEAYAGN